MRWDWRRAWFRRRILFPHGQPPLDPRTRLVLAALPAQAAGAGSLRIRLQGVVSWLPRVRTLDLAWPRLYGLRAQRPFELAARSVGRADSRMPSDAGRDRRSDTHREAGRRDGLPRAAAAPKSARS